jgi:hypothetical protein
MARTFLLPVQSLWNLHRLFLLFSHLPIQKLVQLFANYNDLLRQVADEEDVSFIDLKSNEFSFSDFNEPSHFNGDGYVKVNTMIAHKFSAIVKY